MHRDWVQTIPLKLFNTESRHKEEFRPAEANLVRMYTCGPTVYSYAHIGNFRTYVFEDLLRRTLKFFGMKVQQVMNLTDVDDKTIRGAIANKVSLDAFTEPFKQAFFQDLQALGIEPAEHYPAATDYIAQMIRMIEGLLEKGLAYRGHDGSIYFSIRKFPRYGCLSHLNLDELKAGASERVATDEYEKDNVADFGLWKIHDPERDGSIFWESPFGPGRPGWHLECSTMATEILGHTIDIHCGGVDNMFPHHENEIAQSEAYTGKRFVRHWLHSEHLIVDGKKMSKSLGNFFTLRDLLKRGYSGLEVRYMLLSTHYRTQLNFTFDGLEGVRVALDRLNSFIRRLREVEGVGGDHVSAITTRTLKQFSEALADDLNISAALGALFDYVREVNALMDADKVSVAEASEALDMLRHVNSVIDVLNFEEESVPAEVEKLAQDREQARRDRNWKLSDELRDRISSQGFAVEDTPKGPRLKRLSKV